MQPIKPKTDEITLPEQIGMTHYKDNIGQPTSCLFTDDSRGLRTTEDPKFVDCPACLERMAQGILREKGKIDRDLVHFKREGEGKPICGTKIEAGIWADWPLSEITCPACRVLMDERGLGDPPFKSIDQLEDELARKLLERLTEDGIANYKLLMEARAARLNATKPQPIMLVPSGKASAEFAEATK